ncbi:acyl-CoA dehydrogenase [Bacillus sp. MUM 116]|uniref:acyl-CoA dehydrogenase family protein n=1 Tax=Bacillus sp. MUM 116 TaxID=1678002 RepID=UPI0008F594B8|nr:acyl-CoA dehydrogenase family protein [Bacillus sp. MUM 116]OIK04427.1 acyl-CoA dehydrogenase [Bacillus sp. MUM 116]
MNFIEKDTIEERLEMMSILAKQFYVRAHQVDVEGTFPYANIEDLKQSGYTALSIPRMYDGEGISLYDLLRLQEKIAEGDGATALSIGWHMGIIMNLGEKGNWEESVFKMLCEEVKKGALINSAATETNTGSPTRGGRPETAAVKVEGGWMITGRKTFTTMSPVLDYFIVSAAIKEADQVGNFLIPRSAQGISIEETWDSIAMRGTGSHDLILNNVKVPDNYFVEKLGGEGKKPSGWLLHIPACYLGIAKAAKNYCIQFAKEYSPSSIKGAIIELPNVQQKIGEIEWRIMQSEYFLYSVAKQWDSSNLVERAQLGPQLGAAKMTVTNLAIEVVDLAMRIVGAKSLSLKNPLQRYYRDVRAGLHNPPMDDMTIQLLAKSAIIKAEV